VDLYRQPLVTVPYADNYTFYNFGSFSLFTEGPDDSWLDHIVAT